jgi:hypothetical protein
MNVLQEADQLTSVDRRADYGHPYDFYLRVSKLWEGITGVPFTPQQIGLMMVAFKIAREVGARKRDNLVDIAGYARTLEMTYEKQDAASSASHEAERAA